MCAASQAGGGLPVDKPAEALYLQLGRVGLDSARVYQVRDAALERGAVHLSLDDGTIAFTEDVMGRITGAFFAGDGEILLTPPNRVERNSMSLFTGMAILEEHFSTAYFRFNDDAANELRPDLRPTDQQKEFVDRWQETARNLATGDANRLLMTFSRMLPVKGQTDSSHGQGLASLPVGADRFLHARLQGNKLGVFDVYFDSTKAEQVQAGQARTAESGGDYYDVWTSFSQNQFSPRLQPDSGSAKRDEKAGSGNESAPESRIQTLRYTIRTEVRPPKEIHARAQMKFELAQGGSRVLWFELSRFLQIESVTLKGEPVEFIHNPAVEGTQLSRRGNDLVAVVLPEPTRAGQEIELEFVYGGEVLAEAGSGLLYVGARGTWYPNWGMVMSDFDLQFDFPPGWTLVATGEPAPVSPGGSISRANGQQTLRWVSERPIPLAGFNLGKYKMVATRAGNVAVHTYAAAGVERDFPRAPIQVIEPDTPDTSARRTPQIIAPSRPSPVHNEINVGEEAAHAIQYYAERFGPYPYRHLALTQMPGPDSQGWPGLVFLSSYAFLDEQGREQLHFRPSEILLQQAIPAHETAHQWWGDLITWSSYRDQWFSEGLASYCALMMLQEKDPAGFRLVMEKFRMDLVEKNKDGASPRDAGPVTLGSRLLSSRFPGGYDAILYGRGTWLFHMLRMMMKDAAAQARRDEGQKGGNAEEPFVRALRQLRQRYEGKSISTGELLDVFAADLPPTLRYEGKKSLDWFLEGWINGTALPKLELKTVKFVPKGSGLVVSGTIVQKDAPQDLVTSVPVYAVTGGKQVLLGRVFADGDETTFRLPAPAGTHKIMLDPNATILTSPR